MSATHPVATMIEKRSTTARNLKLLKPRRLKSHLQKTSLLSGMKQLRRDDPVATTRVVECQVQEALFSIARGGSLTNVVTLSDRDGRS